MKGGRQPLGWKWLVFVFIGALLGAIAGQLVDLQLRGIEQTQRVGIGGIVGGLIGALLGNYLGSHIIKKS